MHEYMHVEGERGGGPEPKGSPLQPAIFARELTRSFVRVCVCSIRTSRGGDDGDGVRDGDGGACG